MLSLPPGHPPLHVSALSWDTRTWLAAAVISMEILRLLVQMQAGIRDSPREPQMQAPPNPAIPSHSYWSSFTNPPNRLAS